MTSKRTRKKQEDKINIQCNFFIDQDLLGMIHAACRVQPFATKSSLLRRALESGLFDIIYEKEIAEQSK